MDGTEGLSFPSPRVTTSYGRSVDLNQEPRCQNSIKMPPRTLEEYFKTKPRVRVEPRCTVNYLLRGVIIGLCCWPLCCVTVPCNGERGGMIWMMTTEECGKSQCVISTPRTRLNRMDMAHSSRSRSRDGATHDEPRRIPPSRSRANNFTR